MAWNRKDLASENVKDARVPVGAPVSANQALVGQPYKDGWDISRAFDQGMKRITWVYRCIDAIASNQARLPAILRAGNSPDGKIITGSNHDILKILNVKSNVGENSFAFRYRLSSQLLLSTRGVFIEKIRGRNGAISGLHLLPPQMTSPIPHAKTFVSGYRVDLPGGDFVIMKPDDVIWLRRPHPLDPYRSLTPMEPLGIAMEIENLAKIYNRNFLLNDGRPGGLLVLQGEIDDDDKEELRSRFRGNISRAGATTVISSDDGAQFIDTAASMRDAAYIEMRAITKEEILIGFGVPESALGSAGGKTFANASEELRVFWMETMGPHLDMIARGLDELDDSHYIDFNTDEVPILVLFKQERERYVMNEVQSGLISPNEYRTQTGRKKVDSELMDSILANPNLTPIGNTEKKFELQQQQPVDQVGVPGAPTPAPLPGQAPAEVPAEPQPESELSAAGGFSTKAFSYNLDEKMEQAEDRWTETLDRALERLFERQGRVVGEKANGAKTRKAVTSGNLALDSIFDQDVWRKQLEEDIRPIITGMVTEANEMAAQEMGVSRASEAEVKQLVDEQMERVSKVNDTTKEEVAAAILSVLALAQSGENEDEAHPLLIATLVAVFAHLLGTRKRRIAESEAQTAMNAGMYLAVPRDGRVKKTWRTRKDSSVRNAHRTLEGKTVPVHEGFVVDGESLRFPGDPLAPAHLVVNCRCKLRFTHN